MDGLTTVIVAAIGGAVSLIPLAIGVFVRRSRGMPAINAEVEALTERLMAGLRAELATAKAAFDGCTTELDRVSRELRETRRELRDTEGELLHLYRETGRRPSQRLIDREQDGS